MRPPDLLHLNNLKTLWATLFGHQVQMVAKSNECQWYQSPCHRIPPLSLSLSLSPTAYSSCSSPLWQWPEFMPPIIPFWHMYKHTWLHMYVYACRHVYIGVWTCVWLRVSLYVCVSGVLCLLSTLGTVCTAAKYATQQHLQIGGCSIQISFHTHFDIYNCVFTHSHLCGCSYSW